MPERGVPCRTVSPVPHEDPNETIGLRDREAAAMRRPLRETGPQDRFGALAGGGAREVAKLAVRLLAWQPFEGAPEMHLSVLRSSRLHEQIDGELNELQVESLVLEFL